MDLNEYLQKFKMVEKLKQYDEIFCNYFFSDNPSFPRTRQYNKPEGDIYHYEELECDGTEEIYNGDRTWTEREYSYYIIDYFWQSFAPVDIALFYASMGYRVLPTNGILPPSMNHIEKYKGKKTDEEIHYNWSKIPFKMNEWKGVKSATTDPDIIIKWFSRGATGIGVVGGDKALFLDVDNKNGWYGFDDIQAISNHVPAPDTFTPLNGCHITLSAPSNYYSIKNTKLRTSSLLCASDYEFKKKYGKGQPIPRMGVDIRAGDSAYALSAGSIVHHPLKLGETIRYKGFLLPPELQPEIGNLHKLFDYDQYKNVPKDNKYRGTEKEAIDRLSARDYVPEKIFNACRNDVMNMSESIEGSNGHSAMFAVCCNVFKDWKLNYEQGMMIVKEYNEQNAKPEWDYTELRHKIKDAYEKCLSEPQKVGYKQLKANFGTSHNTPNQFTNYITNETVNDMDVTQNNTDENNESKPNVNETNVNENNANNVPAESQNNNSSKKEADDDIGEEIKDVKKVSYRNVDPKPFFDAFNCVTEVSLFAKETAKLRKSPVGLFFLAYLNGFSALLGNYYAVQLKNWTVPGGGFNVLLLADSGVGKSSTAGKAIEPLWNIQERIFNKEIKLFHTKEDKEAYDNSQNMEYQLCKKIEEEANKNKDENATNENKQEDKADKYIDDGEPPLFMGSNHTYERVCLELADHKRFFWYWDEYMGLSKKMCPGGIDNGNVNSLNTLCERGVVDYGTKQAKDLKGRKTGYAKDVVITIGGNSTIDDFIKAKQVQPLWNSGHFNRYAIGVFFSEKGDDRQKSIEELALEEVAEEELSYIDDYWKNYNGFMGTAFHNLYKNKYFDTKPTVFTLNREARIELKKYEIICRRRNEQSKEKASFAQRLIFKAVQVALIIHLSKIVKELNGLDNDDKEYFLESLITRNAFITTDEIKQGVAIAEYIWESFLRFLMVKANQGIVTGLSPISEYIYKQMTEREETNKGKEYMGMSVADIKRFTEFRATIKTGKKIRSGLHYLKGKGNTHIVSALQELSNAKLAQIYAEDDGKQYWRISAYLNDTQE